MQRIAFFPAFLFALSLVFVSGCSAPDSTTEATPEPRVAFAPTGADQMPPAILGNGGALEGMDLHYVDGDSATTGYLSVPEGDGPFPALVIIHEWNGLSDRVRQVADDFAAEGYITLAVDLFSGRVGTTTEENMALITEAN